MPSQLAESTFLKLLRQFYFSPVCHAYQRLQNVPARRHTRTFQTSTTQRKRDQVPLVLGAAVDNHACKDYNNGHVPLGLSKSSSAVPKYQPANSNTPKPTQRIAVLGGGITGLTTAYYLSQELPNSKIILYEGSSRLGGWLSTKQVNVGNGAVSFEQGPRTIRPTPAPQALVMFELMSKLKDHEALHAKQDILDLALETKASPASQNRFIYYPDHLVRMPGPGADPYEQGWSVLTEPVFRGLIPSIVGEYFRDKRPMNLEDESVGSFLKRRFNSVYPGENIISALLHGIYAGDINQLSIKSIFPSFWEAERGFNSLTNWQIQQASNKTRIMQKRDAKLTQELARNAMVSQMVYKMKPMSLYSFGTGGITNLSHALEAVLKSTPNVEIRMEEPISKLKLDDKTNMIGITSLKQDGPMQFDNVISTLSSRVLSSIIKEGGLSPVALLEETHFVTVMVVNLCYTNPDLLPVNGFGYLIPRSVPIAQNPERALGVIFDSALSKEQDTPYTKITVMLGGHWWDDFTVYPDEDEAAAMAKAVLKRHLKIEEEPAAVLVGLQHECIPQYTVGHDSRMKTTHYDLLRAFSGRLSVAGNSYTGVGINDCVRAARDVAMDVSKCKGVLGVTGLEQFQNQREWVSVSGDM